MMKFTVQESGQGVPVGLYQAVFEGIEDVPENVEKGYKSGFKFKFKVLDKEHEGAIASRILGGTRPTTKNGLGKFLAEMTGVPLANGVDYDVEPCLGKPFTIVVKAGESGGTRVDTVIPKK